MLSSRHFPCLVPKRILGTRRFSRRQPYSTLNNTSSSPGGYRISKPPAGLPVSKLITKGIIFPVSVRESFKDFSKRHQLGQLQYDLLSILPFYPEPSRLHSSEIVQTIIDESTGDYINEFHISPRSSIKAGHTDKHVVFIHGYGAGLGFFVKNLQYIAEMRPDWHIHAIDLPGYGCSSRPDFPHNIQFSHYQEIEQWFIDRLSMWFKKRKLDSSNTMVVAHSMGAYLSCVLNFQHPDFFNHMLLVSPAGIYHSRKEEVLAAIPSWFQKLWNRNISPFSLVRNSGPFGSTLVSGWTSRRFSKNNTILTPHEQKLMHMYTYGIFNAKGSGEYMLNYFLAPGGVPRHSLLNRIQNLKCHTTWLYGSHDWMDKLGGFEACRIIRESSKLSGHPLEAICKIVQDAGHHIYLDNFEEFNQLVTQEMDRFGKC
ncbi:hypothetical protein FOA43_003417 [Brettanomyces nanus]|uniref:AB hydrolase-1 domain-containing protein n=1 Tax=Eeniella nana TaxID=13502 RepID=A0A875S2U5_EENNA|nr:uncharacterized protein FOA43_003417 [Brettanomyces nanus]QPG76031.1 hypothetical protein FOA43_003417 [Brettanomyces nanus]